jgi:DNA-binding MarR family transcriptional regulator
MALLGITLDEYRALAEFRRTLRRFLAFSAQAARVGGVEPQQHQLLLALQGLPASVEATIGALAEHLEIRHHSAVELVDRMEARGLVRRARRAKDLRQVLVQLTPRGRGLLLRLTLAHRAELRSVGPALVRTLGEVLRPPALVRHAESRHARGR